MEKHWCPVCDQGWVEPVTFTSGEVAGHLCGECEAFWETLPLDAERFVQWSVWLAERGGE